MGPKYPESGLIPTLFWNSMRAAFVSDPKYWVAPLAASFRAAEPAFSATRTERCVAGDRFNAFLLIASGSDKKGLNGLIARLFGQHPMRENQYPVDAVVDIKGPRGRLPSLGIVRCHDGDKIKLGKIKCRIDLFERFECRRRVLSWRQSHWPTERCECPRLFDHPICDIAQRSRLTSWRQKAGRINFLPDLR